MDLDVYILRASPSPWGDYGSILRHGMCAHADRDELGRLPLERTGPFVPPITFPGISDVVITGDLKRELEAASLGVVTFVPVWKKRIVKLAWHEWDETAAEPASYPAGGEPENYVLGRRHDAELAEAIGDLWEVCMPEKLGLQLPERRLDPNLYAGEPLVRASRWGCLFVSLSLKQWLESHVGDWVQLERARTADAG